ELADTIKAEVEAKKHFRSRQVDRFRVAYVHYIEDFPRQCSFISTTNKGDCLRDETGGRRFWRMTVNPERFEVNWSKLTKEENDQSWAEAKDYYE
ncbi:VapE domain-containing protein, partial [Staphylococcus aureus]